MHLVIDGKLYDTEKATKIAESEGSFFSEIEIDYKETLYKTDDGEYFLTREEWRLDENHVLDMQEDDPAVSLVYRMSDEEARDWSMNHEINCWTFTKERVS